MGICYIMLYTYVIYHTLHIYSIHTQLFIIYILLHVSFFVYSTLYHIYSLTTQHILIHIYYTTYPHIHSYIYSIPIMRLYIPYTLKSYTFTYTFTYYIHTIYPIYTPYTYIQYANRNSLFTIQPIPTRISPYKSTRKKSINNNNH